MKDFSLVDHNTTIQHISLRREEHKNILSFLQGSDLPTTPRESSDEQRANTVINGADFHVYSTHGRHSNHIKCTYTAHEKQSLKTRE